MMHSIKHVKEEVNIALKRYNQQIIFQDTRCYNLFLSLLKKNSSLNPNPDKFLDGFKQPVDVQSY